MTYETLCHRLTTCYDAGEAKALVRWVLDVRFGLSLVDILCGKVQNWKKSCEGLKKGNLYNI